MYLLNKIHFITYFDYKKAKITCFIVYFVIKRFYMSCDVEGSVKKYMNNKLGSNRRSFSFENSKHHIIVSCSIFK